MATMGKCEACGAAFIFKSRKGYPTCPHCEGGELVRTSNQYGGAWFAIGGITTREATGRAWSITPVAALSPTQDINAYNPTVRAAYYAHIAAFQAWEVAQFWCDYWANSDHGLAPEEANARRADHALLRERAIADADRARDKWAAAKDAAYEATKAELAAAQAAHTARVVASATVALDRMADALDGATISLGEAEPTPAPGSMADRAKAASETIAIPDPALVAWAEREEDARRTELARIKATRGHRFNEQWDAHEAWMAASEIAHTLRSRARNAGMHGGEVMAQLAPGDVLRDWTSTGATGAEWALDSVVENTQWGVVNIFYFRKVGGDSYRLRDIQEPELRRHLYNGSMMFVRKGAKPEPTPEPEGEAEKLAAALAVANAAGEEAAALLASGVDHHEVEGMMFTEEAPGSWRSENPTAGERREGSDRRASERRRYTSPEGGDPVAALMAEGRGETWDEAAAIVAARAQRQDAVPPVEVCAICHGYGRLGDDIPCLACNGAGSWDAGLPEPEPEPETVIYGVTLAEFLAIPADPYRVPTGGREATSRMARSLPLPVAGSAGRSARECAVLAAFTSWMRENGYHLAEYGKQDDGSRVSCEVRTPGTIAAFLDR